MISSRKKKIGILIVAYNAATTISNVISRIPETAWEHIAEVFIFDDKSYDSTSHIAELERQQHLHGDKIKIFYNAVNLGYGGNQKRGYLYAIEQGMDIVVLLHGDGQYAPELIEEMIEPLIRGQADAVFGSRMLVPKSALTGGMPLYKYIGNRILTRFQNIILGANLSEYHSGYRAYTVETLKKIPFCRNSNDFHFDNEIIIQLLEGKMRIDEIDIPTYYGDEICYVNGLKYAKDVILSTIKYRLHKAQVGAYFPIFDLKSEVKYTVKRNRFSSHSRLIGFIHELEAKKNAKALDVGCGSGFLAKHIKNAGYSVTGVDMYNSSEARANCDYFHVYDIANGFGVAPGEKFDLIVFADVLEHLHDPETTLLRSRDYLKSDGRIIASTGNIAHLYIRLCLLCGHFNYTERGILDRTHLHLFTIKTFKHLFAECGYKILRQQYCPVPFENVLHGMTRTTDCLAWINNVFARLIPSLFAYQIVLTAELDPKCDSTLLRQRQINAPFKEWFG